MIYIRTRRVKIDKTTSTYKNPPSGIAYRRCASWDSSWHDGVKILVEETINRFVLEFLEFPYLHHSEESLQCELYKALSNQKLLGMTYPLQTGEETQPLHKGWAKFDLCILEPEKLEAASLQDFKQGRIHPSVAIEIGLDLNLSHLQASAEKLFHSGIEDIYIIHLIRPDVTDDFVAIERFLLNSAVRTAYARVTASEIVYKLLNSTTIQVK